MASASNSPPKESEVEQATQDSERNVIPSLVTPRDFSKKSAKGSKRTVGSKKTARSSKKTANSKKKLGSNKMSRKLMKSRSPSVKKGSRGKRSVKRKQPSQETDDMPPTANSENSSKKNQKNKNKKKSAENEKKESPPKVPAAVGATPGAAATPSTTTPFAKTVTVEEVKTPKKKKRRPLQRETNHVFHLRPGVNRKVEHMRQRNFEEEIMQFETGQFTYLTDPTRYRFRSVPKMELVIQYVFPSLLILALMLSTMTITRFLTSETAPVIIHGELSEMTLVKYDSYMVVDDIDDYLRNETVLREMNCPGLIQGPYLPLMEHEIHFLNFEKDVVSRGAKALTFRWMFQIDAIMDMNFNCPPSVIIELIK